jgi:hypothetical protein
MIKSRRIRLAGNVARVGEKLNAYTVSVQKAEGKTSLGRLGRSWNDNNKKDLRAIIWRGMDWIHLG